ncbi:MAG: hypothetical protein OXD01_00285 [Gammaproteobacteria bacterium]|nr:hypothetical protein [Gammaproteobacteria bacterium]
MSSIDLCSVTVRPTHSAAEHRRWDHLVGEHHYLHYHGIIEFAPCGHVAMVSETWLALIG